ncbi:hypothetical protein WCE34_10345 [Luteimonas sp. MJ204]|uniref:hypothetical protein n=1 Tax=Luteimonas sp. MJ145 TaxID=3129234 RepID=UPI0031BB8F51
MNPSFAQAAPQAMQPGDPGYEVILDAATAPLREALDGRVELEVERMDRIGGWAFVLGSMRAPGGGRPDLAGTRFAEAAEQGAMSDVYVALLKHEGAADGSVDAGDSRTGDAHDPTVAEEASAIPSDGHWTLLEHAIGPGDVAWLDWPQRHAAPRALFGF